MLARLDPTDQGGETHIDGGGVSSGGRAKRSAARPLWSLPTLTEPHELAETVGWVDGSAGLVAASGEHGSRLPHPGTGVFDHAERGGVAAFVIDAVAVEEVDVGEGAMTRRAVRAFDAVPAVGAAGTGHRQPGGLVLGHHRSVRAPTDRKSLIGRARPDDRVLSLAASGGVPASRSSAASASFW